MIPQDDKMVCITAHSAPNAHKSIESTKLSCGITYSGFAYLVVLPIEIQLVQEALNVGSSALFILRKQQMILTYKVLTKKRDLNHITNTAKT